MKLTEIVKKQILKEYEKGSPESVAEELVDMLDDLQRYKIKRIKYDKVRKWTLNNPRGAKDIKHAVAKLIGWLGLVK